MPRGSRSADGEALRERLRLTLRERLRGLPLRTCTMLGCWFMVVTGEKRLFVVLLCSMDVAAQPRAGRHSGLANPKASPGLAIERRLCRSLQA